MIRGPLTLYSYTDWDDEPEEYVDPKAPIDSAVQLAFITNRPLYEVGFDFYYDDVMEDWILGKVSTGEHTLETTL